jgi:hypothetical protein
VPAEEVPEAELEEEPPAEEDPDAELGEEPPAEEETLGEGELVDPAPGRCSATNHTSTSVASASRAIW